MRAKTVIKIGITSLFSHWMRLIAVVALATVALGFLGAAVTAACFNEEQAREESLYAYESGYAVESDTYLTEEALSALHAASGKAYACGVQSVYSDNYTAVYNWSYFVPLDAEPTESLVCMYQSPEYIVCANEEYLAEEGMTLTGRLPENENEVAISTCQYHYFHQYGYYDEIASPVTLDYEEQTYLFDSAYSRAVPDRETIVDGTFRILLADPDGGSIPAVIVGVVDYGECNADHKEFYMQQEDRYDNLYVSASLVRRTAQKLYGEEEAVCGYALFAKAEGLRANAALFRYVEDTESLSFISTVLKGIDDNIARLNSLKATFFWIGLGLTVFSLALIWQFISFSVESRKADVGILRALGAGKRDVVAIFLVESLALALLQGIAGLLFSFIASAVVNAAVIEAVGSSVVYMSFTLFSPVAVFGVSIAACTLSSCIPIYRAAKRPPVETIRQGEL